MPLGSSGAKAEPASKRRDHINLFDDPVCPNRFSLAYDTEFGALSPDKMI